MHVGAAAPSAARAEHGVRIFGATAAAVVAAERQVQVAALDDRGSGAG